MLQHLRLASKSALTSGELGRKSCEVSNTCESEANKKQGGTDSGAISCKVHVEVECSNRRSIGESVSLAKFSAVCESCSLRPSDHCIFNCTGASRRPADFQMSQFGKVMSSNMSLNISNISLTVISYHADGRVLFPGVTCQRILRSHAQVMRVKSPCPESDERGGRKFTTATVA